MTWGLSSAVARGLIGSAGRSGALAGEWEADLPRTWAPDLDQTWVDDAPERPGALASSAAEPLAELWGDDTASGAALTQLTALPVAELEDLGSRRLS